MGLILRLAIPSVDDRDVKKRCGEEYLWKDYLDKIVAILYTRHTNALKIILVNDNYTGSSIKDDEHDRRASKHRSLPNIFPKVRDKFPSPGQYNKFLLKAENKVRLQKILKNHLIGEVKKHQPVVIYCETEVATNLNENVENSDFSFKQAEADTMIFTAYSVLRNTYEGPVIVDSEDTDVYVQSSFVSHQSTGDLYIKNKINYFNCRELISYNMSKIIIQLHIITGSDHTSGFFGHGKKSIFDMVKKDQNSQEMLQNVGCSLSLEKEVIANMREFILTKVYRENAKTCGEARSSKWKKLKKKTMIRLPPDNDSLMQHFKRCNYLSFCQMNYDMKHHPSPIGNGWEIINGKCRPVRYTVPALPNQFVFIPSIDDDESESEVSEYGDSSGSDDK